MSGVAIQFNEHNLVVRLTVLAAQLARPEALVKVVGREARNRTVAHFHAKDQTPNRLNPGRRQHYWHRVAGSVHQPELAEAGTAVRITIADPTFAQKVHGGTITRKRAGALTIPVSPDAYGRTTKTFEGETGRELFRLRVGGTRSNPFVNAVLATARGGGIQVEYLLTPSVTQDKDPTALPERGAFEAALVARAEKFVARQTAQADGQAPASPA